MTNDVARLSRSSRLSQSQQRHRIRSQRSSSMAGVKLDPSARLQPPLPSTPARSRSGDRRGHDADLPDLDLRPGRARPAQGLRVRAHAEPDARRARGQPGRARGRQARPSPSRPAWRRPRVAVAAQSAITWSPATTSTAARTACSSRCCRSYGLDVHLRRHVATSTRSSAAIRPATRLLFVETPTNPMHAAHRPRGGGRRSRTARRAGRRRQHVREPVPAAAARARRRPRRPLHHQVPQRPQRHRRRRRRRTRDERRVAAVPPERRRRDPRPVRLPGSCCAAPRRWRCAWSSTAPTASRLATFLADHPKVSPVLYPGLPDHPQHALARAQMSGFGGMLAFDMGSIEAARRVGRAREALHAGREPGRRRVAHRPPRLDDARLGPAEHRAALGLADGLVRLSAGIEDVDDLTADLSRRSHGLAATCIVRLGHQPGAVGGAGAPVKGQESRARRRGASRAAGPRAPRRARAASSRRAGHSAASSTAPCPGRSSAGPRQSARTPRGARRRARGRCAPPHRNSQARSSARAHRRRRAGGIGLSITALGVFAHPCRLRPMRRPDRRRPRRRDGRAGQPPPRRGPAGRDGCCARLGPDHAGADRRRFGRRTAGSNAATSRSASSRRRRSSPASISRTPSSACAPSGSKPPIRQSSRTSRGASWK